MPQFILHTIDDKPCGPWRDIYAACARYPRAMLEVRRYDEQAETSLQQMKWWHDQPIPAYAEMTGHSEWYAEILLKKENRHHFMKNLREQEGRRGRVMIECLTGHCGNLFIRAAQNKDGLLCCPQCGGMKLMPFFMLSKTELTVKQFGEVMENTVDYLNRIGCPVTLPDPLKARNRRKS